MLKIAISYKEKINECFQDVAFNSRYRYYDPYCWNYEAKIDVNSFDKLQFVSVNNDEEVLGYYSANIYRQGNMISSISVINFKEDNLTASKDLHKFLTELFTVHSFRKIEWSVFVGNPAEKMYDKIIKKYGGKIVGTKIATAVLQNGIMIDEKEYEIFKTDYDSSIQKLIKQ